MTERAKKLLAGRSLPRFVEEFATSAEPIDGHQGGGVPYLNFLADRIWKLAERMNGDNPSGYRISKYAEGVNLEHQPDTIEEATRTVLTDEEMYSVPFEAGDGRGEKSILAARLYSWMAARYYEECESKEDHNLEKIPLDIEVDVGGEVFLAVTLKYGDKSFSFELDEWFAGFSYNGSLDPNGETIDSYDRFWSDYAVRPKVDSLKKMSGEDVLKAGYSEGWLKEGVDEYVAIPNPGVAGGVTIVSLEA